MDPRLIKQSKFLSLVLRHDPSVVGVELDEAGWVEVDCLLKAIARRRDDFSRARIEEIVATSEKQRFVFSEDGLRIRAAQGHSLGINLGLEPALPPGILYHGTAERNLESIRIKGLIRGQRDHVHLSPDPETATAVGRRHGRPIVLSVDAESMEKEGHCFFQADNGVWLTDHVPATFLQPLSESESPDSP